MSRLPNWSLFVVLAAALAFAGCSTFTPPSRAPPATPAASEPAAEATPANQGSGQGHEGHEHATGASSEHAEALAELSDADRASAEKQKTCPVSGAALGSMGKPYKVTVNDQDVFLCCQGCEGKIRGDPDKYMAKINE